MTVCAVYSRKSNDQAGVADEDRSVARQVEHAKLYAARKGWAVLDECVFVDDGASGADFSRPGLVRLLATLAPRPAFSVLIVSEGSRLGREAIESAFVLKRLSQAGVRVWEYLTDREIAVDTPQAKLLAAVLGITDEIERERARQRTADALLRMARAGKVVGGTIFGYRNRAVLGEPDASGQRRRLHTERVVDAAEAEVVRRIFRMCAEGYGFRRLAVQLNDEWVPSPRPRRAGRSQSWAPSSVREILHRETYIGVVVYNRVRKRDTWGRKTYEERPECEWVRVSAPELRIVTDEEWAAARSRLTASRSSYIKATGGLLYGRPVNGATSPYLLTGMATCAECRGSLIIRTRDHKSHGRRPFYSCSYHLHRGSSVCGNGLEVAMDATNRAVLAAINGTVMRRPVIEAAIGMALADLQPSRHAQESERETLVVSLRQLEAELARLVAAVAAGAGEVPALVAALRQAEQRRADFQRRLAARDRPAAIADLKGVELEIRRRARDWRAVLGRQTDQARGVLQQLLADRIVFTPHVEEGRRWYDFAGTAHLGGMLAGGVSQAVVTPAGFEPAISTLKGSRPGPG
jgi:site-specific DNA recombinase